MFHRLSKTYLCAWPETNMILEVVVNNYVGQKPQHMNQVHERYRGIRRIDESNRTKITEQIALPPHLRPKKLFYGPFQCDISDAVYFYGSHVVFVYS